MSIDNFLKQAEELRTNLDIQKEQIRNLPTKEVLQEMEQLKNRKHQKEEAKSLTDEIYRRAIENIKISEWERIKINKNDFADKDEVIDILLYAVGKMAQDPIFYKLNIVKLKEHTPLYKNN